MMKKGYTPKGKLGSGSRFKSVSDSVQSEYVKKGYTAKKAKQVAGAVAAEAGRKAHGNAKMASLAKKGE